jgi:RNA polymerase sigma factor (sigma-70 family)
MGPEPEELARRALGGDRAAVADLVRVLQGGVFALAVRMLWDRADAEDATQEILVRVITRLSQFDFRSALRTWVYQIALHHLLDVKKSATERMRLGFEPFAEDLATPSSGPPDDERSVLVEEVKLGCTLAMLQCLDRSHRAAYLLGCVLELPAEDAAAALGVAPAAYRKRLERARGRIEAFTAAHCGLVSDAAACRCNLRVDAAVACGRAVPGAPRHAEAARSFAEARDWVRRAEGARRAIEVHRLGGIEPRVDFAQRTVEALLPE